MGELRQQTGLISGFLKVTLVQENSGPGSRSQVSDLATLAGDTAQTCLSPLVLASATRHSEKENLSTALREDPGGRGPPSREAAAAPSVPAEKGCAYRRSRPSQAGTCPSAAPRSRTTRARCLGRPIAGLHSKYRLSLAAAYPTLWLLSPPLQPPPPGSPCLHPSL